MQGSTFRIAFCLALALAAPTLAMDETLLVPSGTINDEDFLRGDGSAAVPVTISGRLSGPDSTDPVPVVILLHGSDGPTSGAAGAWRAFLNGLGVTTLRLESYTARGIEQISSDQDAFGQFQPIYDAYRAADALAADPRIDGARIVLMGFSRGGSAALYSAMTRFQDAFGPDSARIVAHLSFYPACNFELADELDVSEASIRVFHGADDDWTLASVCRGYIDRLAAAGADVAMTEYPNALHGFDNPSNPAYFSDPDNMTSRNCMRREANGQLINTATGKPFSYRDDCIEYGPASRYDDAAATAAKEAVASLLGDIIGRELAP